MAFSTSFSKFDISMIKISDLTNSRVTGLVDAPDFARRHFHQAISAFAIVQRRLLTSAARNLSAAPRHKLDIVNVCA